MMLVLWLAVCGLAAFLYFHSVVYAAVGVLGGVVVYWGVSAVRNA